MLDHEHGHSHDHDEPPWLNRLMLILAGVITAICIGVFIYVKKHGFP